MLCFVMAGLMLRVMFFGLEMLSVEIFFLIGLKKNMLKNAGFVFLDACGFWVYFRIMSPFGLVFVDFWTLAFLGFAIFAVRDETESFAYFKPFSPLFALSGLSKNTGFYTFWIGFCRWRFGLTCLLDWLIDICFMLALPCRWCCLITGLPDYCLMFYRLF